MNPTRTHRKDPARLKRKDVADMWNAIEGALADAMKMHPEYFTDAGLQNALRSMTKRAVGHLIALQTRKGGRQGGLTLAQARSTPDRGCQPQPAGAALSKGAGVGADFTHPVSRKGVGTSDAHPTFRRGEA